MALSSTDGSTSDRRGRRVARSGRDLAVDELPVLPGVVVRLMGLSPSSAQFFEEVLTIASEDPGLALRVIRAANSPLSAPLTPIESIEGAVARLGANHIAELVTSAAIARVFVPRTPGQADLWTHAIEVATAARAIVAHHPVEGISTEHAYLAGLLHDIGRFILFDQAPEFIQAVDDLAWTTPGELIDAERQVCGVDHAELGGQVCAHWDVPERILTVVRQHHQPLADVSEAARPLLATVKIADWLSIWHRTHDDTEDLAEAIAIDLPDVDVTATSRAPFVTADQLARLLPEVVDASARAARDLGLARS